jgi:hypothetical protein
MCLAGPLTTTTTVLGPLTLVHKPVCERAFQDYIFPGQVRSSRRLRPARMRPLFRSRPRVKDGQPNAATLYAIAPDVSAETPGHIRPGPGPPQMRRQGRFQNVNKTLTET